MLFFLSSKCSEVPSFNIPFLCSVPLSAMLLSLLATSSLSFPSSQNVLISSSFLKNVFAGLTVLFLQHLKKYCAASCGLQGF
jgi:hypothetical protein